MFQEIAKQLTEANRSKMELERLTQTVGFRVSHEDIDDSNKPFGCFC